jgi:hypothetical protein
MSVANERRDDVSPGGPGGAARRAGRRGILAPGQVARCALVAFCLALAPPLALAQAQATDEAAPAPKPEVKKKKPKKATKPAKAAKPAAEPAAPVAEKAAAADRPAAVLPPREEAPLPRRATAPTPPAQPAASPVSRFEVEGLLGLAIPFDSGVSTGLALRGGALVPFRRIAPNLLLELGAELGFTYHGLSPADGSVMYFDLLPKVRLVAPLNEKVALYGDGGLGLGLARASVNVPLVGSQSDTSLALLLKLAGGAGLEVAPHLSLVGELGLYVYVKSGSATDLRFLVGALYRP